jgi:hypothetical protein
MILQKDLISIFYLLATEPKAKHESVHECVLRERDLVNQASSQQSIEQQAKSHLCLWMPELPWSRQHFQ